MQHVASLSFFLSVSPFASDGLVPAAQLFTEHNVIERMAFLID